MQNTISRRLGRLAVKACALLASQIALHAGPEKGAGHSSFPPVNLGEIVRGEKARAALGAHLPEVAKVYNLSVEDLQKLLNDDPSLAVDKKGRLHFTDPAPEAGELATDAAAPVAATMVLADTFKLHSRPGAKRIIYLDFNGHLLSGTGWNASYNGGRDINAPAWDIDGNPGTFSDTERTRIQQIWQRVAEDYAPFDVDVTTELASEAQITRSSSSDEYYGTRVLVSAISSYFGHYGGIAYLGAFDDVGDTYKPALVFPENLGPNGDKYIAEAVSHEAGHNLGLNHDGTTTGQGYYSGHGSGATGWAPIMGAGYYKEVTQWSKGEYANANNKQDDLAVIQTYGLPYRADDHGNSASAATTLTGAPDVAAAGVIERNTDVDVFAFATDAGAITFTVGSTDLGRNLDVLLELRDANGGLIATGNPIDQLFGAITMNVPAGNYFLHVRGTGVGDPLAAGYSTYGSLGQYWVSGTIVGIDSTGASDPVAVASATPTTGSAPLAVTFDGTRSIDADGTISSYQWSFGDGTTGTGATAQHTYQTAGTYTATLTVTDNDGNSASTNLVVQATAAAVTGIRVQAIGLSVVRQPSGSYVRATVKITDSVGTPISGATVSGSFNSVVSGVVTATTDASGNAVLISRRSKKSGTVTFSVTGLAKAGYTYVASQNVQSSATIALQ